MSTAQQYKRIAPFPNRLERTGLLDGGVLRPRSVVIDGAYLRWEDSEPIAPQAWKGIKDRTLTDFVKLADAPSESIAEFARRWGVLRPLRATLIRPAGMEPVFMTSDSSVWSVSDQRYVVGEEPLSLWRSLSIRIRAVLRISAAIKSGIRGHRETFGPKEDWAVLHPDMNAYGDIPLAGTWSDLNTGPVSYPDDSREAQVLLMFQVNRLLSAGSVGLELGIAKFKGTEPEWKMQIHYLGLFGALAFRTLVTVVGESSLFACDGCGVPYVRTKRAPRPGQENFCDDCAKVAKLRASKRWKDKNR